ncbi:NnrU family protein [Dongia sp. agr-C8]
MLNLALAATAFVAAHFLISSTGLRPRLVTRLGERGYAALFSAQAFALIAWMAMAFRAAPRDRILWEFPGASHLLLPLMIPVVVLAVGGFLSANPSAVLQASPGTAWRPRGVLTVTRHPVMWAFGGWALLHILANGDLAALIFFGAFAVLALGGTLAIDAKKRRSWPAESWAAYSASTSNLPGWAIAQGRVELDRAGILEWKALAITLAIYSAIVFWLHPHVIGVPLY